MKTNLLKRIIVASAIVLVTGGALYAQEQTPTTPAPNNEPIARKGYGHKMMMHREGKKCEGSRHAMFPNITEDQKSKINELHTKHLEVVTPLKNQLAEKKAHLQSLLTSASVDNKDVDKTIMDITTIEGNKLREAVKLDQQIRSILTPEQRIVFDSKPKFFMHKERGRMHNRNKEIKE